MMKNATNISDEMKPGLKPRGVPRPPESSVRRESITPHDDVVLRNKGHCLYDLDEPFSITLVSLNNVNVAESSLVAITVSVCLSVCLSVS